MMEPVIIPFAIRVPSSSSPEWSSLHSSSDRIFGSIQLHNESQLMFVPMLAPSILVGTLVGTFGTSLKGLGTPRF